MKFRQQKKNLKNAMNKAGKAWDEHPMSRSAMGEYTIAKALYDFYIKGKKNEK